MVRTYLRENRY